MASPTGINPNPNLNQNQTQQHQQQGGHFDIQKLFKPSSSSSSSSSSTTANNLSTAPSLPPPSSTPPPPPYPTASSSSYPPPTGPSFQFHPPYLPYPKLPQDLLPHQQQQQQHLANVTIQPPTQRPISSYAAAPPSPQHVASPNSNITGGGSRLMALLSNSNQKPPDLAQPTIHFSSSASSPSQPSDFSVPNNNSSPSSTTPSAPPLSLATAQQPTPMRLPSRKLPNGRHLFGDHAVYDIDVRLQREVQPQLEVTPITKYGSDPGLVLGRQIAVNKSYICYGLKLGAIRVLDINTALRALLRGHNQVLCFFGFSFGIVLKLLICFSYLT